MSDDQRFALAIEPDLICSFDNLNNDIVDLAFTDKFDEEIKFILRDAAGLPEKLYSIKLYDAAKNLICFNKSKYIKTFILFSDDNRLVESIEVNFENFSFKRYHHYSKGLMQDLIVIPDFKNDPQLLILYSDNKNLNLEVLTQNQSKFNNSYYERLTSNWSNPFLTISDKLNIGYWQADDKKLRLKFLTVKDNTYKPVTKLGTNINALTIISKSNQDYINSNIGYVSLVAAKDNFYLIKGEKSVEIFVGSRTINDLRITDKNQLFFDKNNSIFVADNNSKSFFKLLLFESSKRLSVKKIFSEIELNNYTIQKLDQRNSHLIFTNSKNGIIEIKRLPK